MPEIRPAGPKCSTTGSFTSENHPPKHPKKGLSATRNNVNLLILAKILFEISIHKLIKDPAYNKKGVTGKGLSDLELFETISEWLPKAEGDITDDFLNAIQY